MVAFDNEDGTATPMLMCDEHTGCGSVFSFSEFVKEDKKKRKYYKENKEQKSTQT